MNGEKHISPHVKIKKNLGLGILTAAVFFLFDPNINILDIVPDAIGYILLCLGLSQVAMLSEDISDALKKFKLMIIVSIIKPIAFVLTYGFFPDNERPTTILLFVFVFSLIELILLIPAYSRLFDGIISLWSRRGTEDIYRKDGCVRLGEGLAKFTVIFLIAKVLCSVLPETASLTMDIYTESFVMYLYDYITHFRVIGFIAGAVFGIIWLAKARKFFASLIKEREVMDSLTESFCQSTIEHEGVYIKKNLYYGVFVLMIGAVLCIDLHLPDFNIIPDALAALMLILGGFLLRKYMMNYKKVMSASATYFLSSVLASILKVRYLDEYGFFTAANFKEDAYFDFVWMCVATAIENIAFVVTVFMIILLLRELVKKHTGLESAHSGEVHITSAGRSHLKKLWAVGGLSVFAGFLSVLYEIMLIERGYFTDILWAVDFGVSALFAGAFVLTVLSIWDDIKTRYMYS